MAWPAQLLQDGKPTSANNPQPIAGMAPVYKIRVPVDSAAYTAADVLFQPIRLPNVVAKAGDSVLIHNVFCLDVDDQGLALDIFFFDAEPTVAANNAAWATTDTEMCKCQEIVRIASGDWVDAGPNRVASIASVGKMLLSMTTDFWIAGMAIGAPTYASGYLMLKIGFVRP